MTGAVQPRGAMWRLVHEVGGIRPIASPQEDPEGEGFPMNLRIMGWGSPEPGVG